MTSWRGRDTIDSTRYVLEINGVDGWYDVAYGSRSELSTIYRRLVNGNKSLKGLPYRIVREIKNPEVSP